MFGLSRGPVGQNGELKFGQTGGIGNHIHLHDLAFPHFATNRDTKAPARSHNESDRSTHKNGLRHARNFGKWQSLPRYLGCATQFSGHSRAQDSSIGFPHDIRIQNREEAMDVSRAQSIEERAKRQLEKFQQYLQQEQTVNA